MVIFERILVKKSQTLECLAQSSGGGKLQARIRSRFKLTSKMVNRDIGFEENGV
jgi:hypothetical protein